MSPLHCASFLPGCAAAAAGRHYERRTGRRVLLPGLLTRWCTLELSREERGRARRGEAAPGEKKEVLPVQTTDDRRKKKSREGRGGRGFVMMVRPGSQAAQQQRRLQPPLPTSATRGRAGHGRRCGRGGRSPCLTRTRRSVRQRVRLGPFRGVVLVVPTDTTAPEIKSQSAPHTVATPTERIKPFNKKNRRERAR